jgi:hypothetical protein
MHMRDHAAVQGGAFIVEKRQGGRGGANLAAVSTSEDLPGHPATNRTQAKFERTEESQDSEAVSLDPMKKYEQSLSLLARMRLHNNLARQG